MRHFVKSPTLLVGYLVLGHGIAQCQVVLNEACADTGSARLSPAGTDADYIELFNPGTSSVDLTTWSLTDDTKTANKYVFPPGTTIPANGFVVVWLDSVTYPGLVCTNFSLNSSGEEIGLFNNS